VIGIDAEHAIPCSAKTGEGIDDILEAVITRMPAPKGRADAPPRAMIIDSWFDNYVGVVMLVRVVDGELNKGDRIRLMASDAVYAVEQLGVFTPKAQSRELLKAGEVGFVIAGIKELQAARVGDTITLEKKLPNNAGPASQPLPGFKEIQPQVFAGLYPTEASEYDSLRDALEKLKLNDSSLRYEPEVSQALGFGFRCGFLGLLHMEIVQERLEREFDQDLITTAPSVVYEVELNSKEVIHVENPSKMPDLGRIAEIREPIVRVHLYMPQDYVGPVMTLANQKRGDQINMAYHGRQVMLTYDMPLAEIVLDFFDKLKSVSRGYASMDYEFKEYRAADVVKVDILLNGDKVDALSIIVHRSQSLYRSRAVVSKMRELIARQMYDVAIQAAIGANIIARETIKALRKNVLAKCYGGDISRKRKLLEKTKGRQETHEADRLRRGAAGGVSGHPPSGRLMSSLTGLLYGGLVLYLGGWYLGKWTGNFSLLLLVLTVVTFGYWLAERFVFAPRRMSAAQTLEQQDAVRRKDLARQGITKVDGDVNEAKQAVLAQPWWLDWTAGLFPVILVVFLLRSFLFEPFKIPSAP
jgi:GTP-binding protein LepA